MRGETNDPTDLSSEQNTNTRIDAQTGMMRQRVAVRCLCGCWTYSVVVATEVNGAQKWPGIYQSKMIVPDADGLETKGWLVRMGTGQIP